MILTGSIKPSLNLSPDVDAVLTGILPFWNKNRTDSKPGAYNVRSEMIPVSPKRRSSSDHAAFSTSHVDCVWILLWNSVRSYRGGPSIILLIFGRPSDASQ